jgi:C4-dicarboxylate transporter DctM subunit
VPALFIGGLLCIYAIWTGIRTKVEREPFVWAKLKAALLDGIWALALPVVVLGGIYGGFFNPSEAGAVATVYALFVTMGVYKELDGRKLMRSLIESASLMGTLILIIVLSFGLNEFLNDIQLNEKLIGWIRDMELGPFGFMMLVNVILIVLGALMDSISCTLIFAPILAPVAWEVYGIDPLHFGVVFVVNMEIGYLAPPVATNLFVSAAVFKKPFGQVVRAVMPTLGITIAALIVISDGGWRPRLVEGPCGGDARLDVFRPIEFILLFHVQSRDSLGSPACPCRKHRTALRGSSWERPRSRGFAQAGYAHARGR